MYQFELGMSTGMCGYRYAWVQVCAGMGMCRYGDAVDIALTGEMFYNRYLTFNHEHYKGHSLFVCYFDGVSMLSVPTSKASTCAHTLRRATNIISDPIRSLYVCTHSKSFCTSTKPCNSTEFPLKVSTSLKHIPTT
jgi:hypothetical protein